MASCDNSRRPVLGRPLHVPACPTQGPPNRVGSHVLSRALCLDGPRIGFGAGPDTNRWAAGPGDGLLGMHCLSVSSVAASNFPLSWGARALGSNTVRARPEMHQLCRPASGFSESECSRLAGHRREWDVQDVDAHVPSRGLRCPGLGDAPCTHPTNSASRLPSSHGGHSQQMNRNGVTELNGPHELVVLRSVNSFFA